MSNSIRDNTRRKRYKNNAGMETPLKDISVDCDVNIEVEEPDNNYLP